MARPTVGITTARLFDRLPELYRAADEPLDWPLLRFLALLGDQASAVEELLDRFAGVERVAPLGDVDTLDVTYRPRPGGSDLINPATADAAWLPWLAQHVGVAASRPVTSFAVPYGALPADWPTYTDLSAAFATYADLADATTVTGGGDVDVATLRTAIGTAATAATGSHDALVDVVRPLLTPVDDRPARVAVADNVDGVPFRVRVITYTAETPEPWRVEALLARPDVKPAGVDLALVTIAGATYGDLAADFATYADLDAGFAGYADQAAYVA